jgi:hypothetical protein
MILSVLELGDSGVVRASVTFSRRDGFIVLEIIQPHINFQ